MRKEWDFEDKDDQIQCLYTFMNELMEAEDAHRKEIGPENYHYAMEYISDVDLKNPADSDLKEAFDLLDGREEDFLEYAIDNQIFMFEITTGHGINTREIASWNDDSYHIDFLGHSGTVNGIEVEDMGIALCEGLSKEDIKLALKKSNFSSIEEYYEKTNIPQYLYAEADDYTRVILRSDLDEDELKVKIRSWLDSLKRGKANKAGRRVIIDGKKVLVDDSDRIKKNPTVMKKIRSYLKNPQEKANPVASNYLIGFYDNNKMVGEMTLTEFRETMKAPLSISIDSLIERFNRCMKEKAKLLKRNKK